MPYRNLFPVSLYKFFACECIYFIFNVTFSSKNGSALTSSSNVKSNGFIWLCFWKLLKEKKIYMGEAAEKNTTLSKKKSLPAYNIGCRSCWMVSGPEVNKLKGCSCWREAQILLQVDPIWEIAWPAWPPFVAWASVGIGLRLTILVDGVLI